MTDKEIIKALECLFGCIDCRKCPYSPRYKFPLCQQQVAKDTLDLITRQQAENKRLGKEVDLVSIQFQDLQERYEEAQAEIERLKKKVEELSEVLSDTIRIRYKEAQSEAVKEFTERLKHSFFDNGYESPDVDFDDFVDNLVKEMVGENNAKEKE